MTALALEIAGDGLTLLREGGAPVLEPAYALVEGGAVITGEPARRQYRIRPRHVHRRYWDALGEEEIPGAGLTQADLAHAQLESVWQAHGEGVDAVYLVVPDAYARGQLGLLLGLAQECGLPVAGLVPSALAASTQLLADRQRLHLDAGLGRFTVTEIVSGERLRWMRQEQLDSVGLDALRDRWTRLIGESFLASTRFDPLHDAASEQAMFEALPGWLASVGDAPVTLTLDFQDRHVETQLDAQAFTAAVESAYRALQQLVAAMREPGRGLTLQLGERVATLPGLANMLARLGDTRVVALPRGQAVAGALRRREMFGAGAGGAAVLTRVLPPLAEEESAFSREAPVEVAEAARRSDGDEGRATHVVWRGVAYPLSGEALVVGTTADDGRPSRRIALPAGSAGVSSRHCELRLLEDGAMLTDLSRYGTFVNGGRAGPETRLQPGDVLRVGTPGEELLMIRLA